MKKLLSLCMIILIVLSFSVIFIHQNVSASNLIFYDNFESGDYSDNWIAGNVSLHYPTKTEVVITPIRNAWKEVNGYLIGTDGINPRTGEPAGGDWIYIYTKFKIPTRGVIITAKVKLQDDSNAVIALIADDPKNSTHILAGASIVAYPPDSGWYAYSGTGTKVHMTGNTDGSVVNGKWYTVKIVIPPNGSEIKVYDGDTGELKVVDNYYTVPNTTAYLVLTARGSWGSGANVTYDYVKVTTMSGESIDATSLNSLCNSNMCIQFENPPAGAYTGRLTQFKVDINEDSNPSNDPNLFIGDLRGWQSLRLIYSNCWADINGNYDVSSDRVVFTRTNSDAGIKEKLTYTLDPSKTVFYADTDLTIMNDRKDDITYGMAFISDIYVTSDPGETTYVKGFGIDDNYIDSADPQKVYSWAKNLGFNATIREGKYTSDYVTTINAPNSHLVYMKIERPDVGTYYLGIYSYSPRYAHLITSSSWPHTKQTSFYLETPGEELYSGEQLNGKFAIIYAQSREELFSIAKELGYSSYSSQTTTTSSTSTPTQTTTTSPTSTSTTTTNSPAVTTTTVTTTTTATSTLAPIASSAINTAKNILSKVPGSVDTGDAQTMLDEAQKAYENGDYELAKKFAETAQALAVKSYYDALRVEVQAKENQGYDVSKAKDLLQQAYNEYQRKDYEKALEILTQVDLALKGVSPSSSTSYYPYLAGVLVVLGAVAYLAVSRRKGGETAAKKPESVAPTSTSPSSTGRRGEIVGELEELYTDFELIGQGGFAWVYKARRKRDGKVVALKIPKNLDPATGKSFLREITHWFNLKHPNIVELYDANVLPVPYLEMEYCDKPLSALRKPMDVQQAAMMVFNIAEGLKYAHSKGIIHRDLKPSNVLLKNGIPKISDWGLSKVMSESKSSTTTTSFTLLYAAPEQLSKSQFGHTDERTDIWALGVLFYELVTGKLPFDGSDLGEITFSILSKEPIPPSKLNPDASSMEPIIMKMLAKRKEDRYQSVEELQRDLAKILNLTLSEGLKKSRDIKTTVFYIGDLALVNLKLGNLSEALKYLIDLQLYTGGNNSDLNWLVDQVKLAAEEGVSLGEEAVMKADIIIHQIKMGR
ncbi:serine/threonine-protein kinase [Thermococcus sp.]|uniref:serine/threonine-protein kinase n=1 Tax=Thermococcus sp. TaxID=35749 RepID=UPI0026105B20|nr:serine/threonine-protein kinase [Thermococcus sp.]